MDNILVFFKPTCSKCRTLNQAMKEANMDCKLYDYIAEPPSIELLQEFLDKSGLQAKDIVRTSEELYAKKYAGKKITNKRWLAILHKNPVLIQRPLVIANDRAWIARSDESIQSFLHYAKTH